ncbi:hypothetical protein PhCBS80983_g02285 [Powellomyces hirtus]|uniref:Structural maintenance of chromosomes protein n=1 Tax=Powellomyces hirtus TaxID=109895 RepID=A0A507E6Z8_9FUNG|nr:hypothetical protein PhCBS80983_g02285 [Powellomyces hirtus]
MYIKQIVIQGFKSYKDQTALEPFSPQHNVVVGRNGSGKSNFFCAIRFALSDAYSNMTREERQSLLHEGTGPATLSAFVEVIFDNTDQRFPTGKEEVVLRRTIGLKKDEYSLDKKSITKTEVLSLFETAGFSRSNPYYIVPQGRITALTNAKDAERLQLLKEVAGTRVYEQRRQESLKIMEETDHKRSKIDELLDVIEERLEELESEKEELKQFQDLDRERRCLEYTIYTREQNELNENLEELEEVRRNEVDDSNQRQAQLNEREQNIANIERQIRDTKTEISLIVAERGQADDDRQEYIKAKAHLELIIKDLQDNMTNSLASKTKLQKDLADIQKKVDAKQKEVDDIRPRFEEALRIEITLKERQESGDLERTALYSKQGRTKQFKTKVDRDVYLKHEITTTETNIVSHQNQCSELEEQLEEHRGQVLEMERSIEDVRGRVEARKEEARALIEEEANLRRQRNTLDEKRKELWREESRSIVSAQNAKVEADKCERSLYSMMDKVTGDGLRAIQKIVARENIQGVYGPLYNLFEVDKTFQTAVEVIAGGSLWHVVVDNDQTALNILRHLNRERGGRVTFMPLNRLHPKKTTFPQSNDAVVMLNKLRFDEQYRPAFEQVFGKALICPTLEVASGYARTQGLNCVTLHGDRAERKGALTGGFHDTKRSKLELISKLKELRNTQIREEENAQSLHAEISRVDQEITQCRGKMAELEHQRRALSSTVTSAGEAERIAKEKAILEGIILRKETSLATLRSTIKNMEAQVAAFRAELRSAFTKTLSSEEQARLEELSVEMLQIEADLSTATENRAKLESRKKILEFELSQNLLRKRTDLSVQLENLSTMDPDGNGGLVGDRQSELASIEAKIEQTSSRIVEIDEQVEELNGELRKALEKLDNAKTEQQNAAKTLERHRLVLEKYVSKKTSLLKRKEDCVRSIRELGVLPDDAWERFEGFESNTLLKKLHGVNESLKEYSHVNTKAFEQYLNFTKQRDSLEKRKEELDTSASAIQDLIANLDQRKDEAIERTFTQVAGFFQEVWAKLVPGGTAELIMLRRADGSSATQDEEILSDAEETPEPEPTGHRAARNRSAIDQYTGISIALTFDSTQASSSAPLRMPQLSGGQKSLVALALIFAIQRCDPAPFYLFDEIDAALDAQYRTAVAAMIHSLAPTAQFITTTFRPELLQHADKFYGVTFVNKVSRVQAISKEDAKRFVDETANPTAAAAPDDASQGMTSPMTATVGGMVG